MIRSLLIGYFCLICLKLSAETIYIPDDAPSLQEAVEMAASGDVIQIVTPEFYWTKVEKREGSETLWGDPKGVVIENKDLTIKGLDSGSKAVEVFYYTERINDSYTLYVENSDIVFENITLTFPVGGRYIPSPIVFINADAVVNQCNITGFITFQGNLNLVNSTISGYSWYSEGFYIGYNNSLPAMKIGPANDVMIQIIDSTINSDSHDGYLNLHFEGLENSQVIFDNSQFTAGMANAVWGSIPNKEGADAVQFNNCENVQMSINSCIFRASNGNNASNYRHGIFSGGGNGGNGLLIQNSDITVFSEYTSSKFISGKGGNGLVIDLPFAPDLNDIIHAGNGGHGISIIQSNINIEQGFFDQMELTPGQGGEGDEYQDKIALPGEPGQEVFIDSESRINYMSGINDWMLMQ